MVRDRFPARKKFVRSTDKGRRRFGTLMVSFEAFATYGFPLFLYRLVVLTLCKKLKKEIECLLSSLLWVVGIITSTEMSVPDVRVTGNAILGMA